MTILLYIECYAWAAFLFYDYIIRTAQLNPYDGLD